MKKQYKVIKISQSKMGWMKGELIKLIKEDGFDSIGKLEIAKNDIDGSEFWQAQYLYICSDEIPMYGKWVLSIRGWIGKFGEHENSYPEECKPIIATNDPKFNLSNITESDLRYWVENGHSENVSLVMENKLDKDNNVIDELPYIFNGCVVFAREKTTGQKLDELSGGQSSNWSENANIRKAQRTIENAPKQDIQENGVEQIKNRIKEEYKKYHKSDTIDWVEMAARKIVAAFKQEQPTSKEPVMSAERKVMNFSEWFRDKYPTEHVVFSRRMFAEKYADYKLKASGLFDERDMRECWQASKHFFRTNTQPLNFDQWLTDYKNIRK